MSFRRGPHRVRGQRLGTRLRTQKRCYPYTWGTWKGLGPRGRLRCGLWSPTYTPKHIWKVQWKNMFRVHDPPTMQPTKNSNSHWTESQWFLQRGSSEGQETTTRVSLRILYLFLCSVQSSRFVVSNSLRPHGLQHTRPPGPSPTPGVYSNSWPLSWWSSVNSIFYTWIELIRPKF